MDLHPSGHQARPVRRAGGWSPARLAGILSVVLVTCGSAFGQFMVQPMRINLATYPGRRTVSSFAVENQSTTTPATIDLRLLDLTQDSLGIWQTIEPDAQVTAGPDGARWVNAGTDDQPVQVDISRIRSCAEWLRLDTDSVDLRPLERKTMNLWVQVPAGVQGDYSAALVAQTRMTVVDEDTGVQTPVVLQFLIPVIITVQGRAIRDDIKLLNADLTFREASDYDPSATLVSLTVDNVGRTYVRLVGVTRVYGERGGHWQRIAEIEYPDAGILPGVKVNLQQDIGRQLPSGKYRVEGALYVNRRVAGTIRREIEFSGDSRSIPFVLESALDLDPRDVPLEVRPGATRMTTMQVTNASEDPVTVDAALLLPDHMTVRAWVDEQGNSISGQDFGCVDWVTVQPTQFTLRGYGRQNLRIISSMPTNLANPLPHYYATLRLNATYDSGQVAGTTEGLIYLNTQGVQGAPRVEGVQLRYVESGPSRYIVTAAFSNVGNAHVLPRCRLYLTEMAAAGTTGATWRSLQMSSGAANQRANMLPLERREFTAVLDVASVPPDKTYYLTAVLQYAGGASAQRQAAIRIKDEGGRKVIEGVSLDDVGGPIQIQL